MNDNMKTMLHWVRMRELVRVRKEEGYAHPYLDTPDPIIAKFRFCNVRREDDRVTVWIRQNIRERFRDNPNLWLMMCVARQINWPPALQHLIDTFRAWPIDDRFEPQLMADALNRMADAGEKVFTGAYIVTAPSVKGAKKTDHVALQTIGLLWRDRARIVGPLWNPDGLTNNPVRQPRLEEVHAKLKQYKGWGPFLAYQAVVDMRFTKLLERAEDRGTWAAAGPGTVRGLNRMADRPVDKALDQYDALKQMRALWPLILQETGVEMDFSDVPNVMCETDKYLRVKNGEGTPRALYVPGRGA